MSGDVQPRKRKDKRRKKEGSSLGAIHEPVGSHKFKRSESDDLKIFDVPDQGEKIHVQSEHGVGGNICIKIIFFCLFGLLVAAVGLVYMKSLGSTDVDLPTIEESRFAEYFTGWLDESTDEHEHEALEASLDHDEHDNHEDHDDVEMHENEHEEEDQSAEQDSIFKFFGLGDNEPDDVEESIREDKITESESRFSQNVDGDEQDEEVNERDNEEEEEEAEKEEDEGEDYTEGNGSEEDEEQEEEKGEDNMESDEEEKDEAEDMEEERSEENNENDSAVDSNEQGSEEDEDEDDLSQVDEEDEDLYRASLLKDIKRNQEKAGTLSEKDKDRDSDDIINDSGEDEAEEKSLIKEKLGDEKDIINDRAKEEKDDDDDEEEEEEEKEEEEQEGSEEKENIKVKTENDDLGFEEIEVSEEDLEDIERSKIQGNGKQEESLAEDINNSGIEEQEEEEDSEEEKDSGGVILKLGVGIALIFVAHLVLVKKWKSMNNIPSDENVQTVTETAPEKKEIGNVEATLEPVTSRRQTLIPEDVCLNDDIEEEREEDEELEEEEEEEEEDIGEDEVYENEVEEEEFQKLNVGKIESVEKSPWKIEDTEKEDEELMNNDEIEEEGEEEENESDEEEYEEDDVEDVEEEQEEEDDNVEEELEEEEIEDDEDYLKKKLPNVNERQEEIPPTPPPRARSGRGGQEADEDFEEIKEVEETSQDGPKVGEDVNNISGPEEPKALENKVGNEDEWTFRQELDFADEQFENNPKAAVNTYDNVLSKKPTLIRALIGRARALDVWAEKEKSNAFLKQATDAYKTLLLSHGHRLDDETYIKLAERCIERMRFAGNFISAIDIHKALILKYPNSPKYRNMLAVTYLMMNKIPQARVLLNETLGLWPKDGFALVHYGFILKTSDNNMEEGAKKLIEGIQTREEGVIEGMFFFHLGDALNRLGRAQEAMNWYEMGVKEGLFLSKYQRSLYNVNRLKGQPWWTKEETTYHDFFKKLEDNWREIRREGLELLGSKGVNLFKEEGENLKDTGDWKQLNLYFRGRKQANCNKAPVTCSLVSSFKPAASCTRGQIKFSVMLPNTHVWPHCGPTNCRLRSHLGLVVPKKTFIRVAEETRSWEEGKFIIFDDSFEHEVWHNGTGLRLVLIVDIWHPELTSHERQYLSPI